MENSSGLRPGAKDCYRPRSNFVRPFRILAQECGRTPGTANVSRLRQASCLFRCHSELPRGCLAGEKRNAPSNLTSSPAIVGPRLQPTLHRSSPIRFSLHQAQLSCRVPAWLLGTFSMLAHHQGACQVLFVLRWQRRVSVISGPGRHAGQPRHKWGVVSL
jgi:hypothetical protein